MACARAIALLSHAERKKVGAILVSEGGHGIIAEGYNGTPAGFDNVCETRNAHVWDYRNDVQCDQCCVCHELITWGQPRSEFCGELVTKPEVLHAESNAIAKVARSTNTSEGATLYITLSPCFECSKSIIQAGIKRVVYEEDYRLSEGLALLRKAKIVVEKL